MPAKAFPMYKERSKDAVGGADMQEDERMKNHKLSKSLYPPSRT
jgi:hypothetical protein